jgi:hypothetical protein
MDWDVATIVNVVSAVAVVAGIVFAILQLRQADRARRDAAAVDIVRTVQTPEVRLAVRTILALPPDADPAMIRTDETLLDAALAVDSACEMWGSIVFEGVVEPHMLDRMVGGWVRGTWDRLRVWVQSERSELDNPNVGEWWEWLIDTLESDPDPGKGVGAHVYYLGRRRDSSS